MRALLKLAILFLFISTNARGQSSNIGRLIKSDLKMTFPSVYFKHNSPDYAPMPYSTDSCFKYIANQFNKNINSLVIWRDSAETEKLTRQRIKKLEKALAHYIKKGKPIIHSMGDEQKISRTTIAAGADSSQINYLLSLNSVFDFSKTRIPDEKASKLTHLYHPKIWCWSCWKSGFHMDRKSRNLRRTAKLSKQNKKD